MICFFQTFMERMDMDCYNNLMRFQRVNLLVSKAEVVRRLFTKKKSNFGL